MSIYSCGPCPPSRSHSPLWLHLGQPEWDKLSAPASQWAALSPGVDLWGRKQLSLSNITREGTNALGAPSRGPASGAGSENPRSGRLQGRGPTGAWPGVGRGGGGISPLPVVGAEASESVPAKVGGG